MKVLYFCPSQSMYGDNIALMRIIPHLKEMGVDPFFVVAYEGELSKLLKQKNYPFYVSNCLLWNFYELNKPLHNWLRGLLFRLKNYRKNKKMVEMGIKHLKNKGFDLVHSNSSNSSFGFEIARKLGIPHVWHIREYGKLDANKQYFPSFKVFLHKLKDSNNTNICITPLIKDYFNLANEGIVVYDGVIENGSKFPVISQKKKQFLYVGRLFEKKGVEMLLSAFSKACHSDKDFTLLFAGQGTDNYQHYLVGKIQELGIGDRVKFLGYVKDPSRLMQESKAIIVASEFEGFGFITAEAMFNGCLVIGRNTAGTKLQFDNILNDTGHDGAIRFIDEDELVAKLEDVMKGDVQDIDLQANQHYVYKKYNTLRSAENVYNVYKMLI